MNASGSSTKTSTRTVLEPRVSGVSQRLFAGSPRKNGAPWTLSPTTLPRFQSSVAPSASAYQIAAAEASGTASMTEIAGPAVSDATLSVPGPGQPVRDLPDVSVRVGEAGRADAPRSVHRPIEQLHSASLQLRA